VKIAVYCHRLTYYSGIPKVARDVIRVLQRENEITVVTSEYKEEHIPASEDTKIILAHTWLQASNAKLARFESLIKIRNGLDSLIALPKKIDADIFFEADAMYYLAYLAKRRYQIPTIVYIHCPLFATTLFNTLPCKVVRPLLPFLERKMYNSLDLILCNSIYIKSLIESKLSLEAQVLYPATDINTFKPDPVVMRDNLVLAVGIFAPHKHQLEMVQAFKEIRGDYELVLAGGIDRKYESYYQEISRMAGADDRISVIPDASPEQIVHLYQEAAVSWHMNPLEHFGIVVREAAACGVPVVAFKGGGINEAIIDSETGFLVQNQQEFIDKTLFLLKNKGTRDALGKQAREYIVKNCSFEIFSRRLKELMSSIC